MFPDRVSNPGPLTYDSGVLPIALRGPAWVWTKMTIFFLFTYTDLPSIYDLLLLLCCCFTSTVNI